MSGTSGSSGHSGTSGSSGTGGIAWGTVKSWGWGYSQHSPPTTTMSDSPQWFAISGSSYSHTGATFGVGIGNNNPTSMLSVKNGSSTLNVNNMKGIDLRKTIRSKRVTASDCV